MFKYISQILAQFTKTQRILALTIVLFSIIVVSLAPSYISTITMDRTELEDKIKRQDAKIKTLESQIDTLDFKIRISRTDCTNEILTREQEFIRMLDELRGDMVKYNSPVRRRDNRQIMVDTVMLSQRKMIQLPEEPVFNAKPMITKIDRMKSKITKNK